jgi:hypothetical protein
MSDSYGDDGHPVPHDWQTQIIDIHGASKEWICIPLEFRFDAGVIPGIGWNTYGPGICQPTTVDDGGEGGGLGFFRYLKDIRLYRQRHGWNMFWAEGTEAQALASPPWTDFEWRSFNYWDYSLKKREWNRSLLGTVATKNRPAVPADPTFAKADNIFAIDYQSFLLSISHRPFDVNFTNSGEVTKIKAPEFAKFDAGNLEWDPERGGPGAYYFKKGTALTWQVRAVKYLPETTVCVGPLGSDPETGQPYTGVNSTHHETDDVCRRYLGSECRSPVGRARRWPHRSRRKHRRCELEFRVGREGICSGCDGLP